MPKTSAFWNSYDACEARPADMNRKKIEAMTKKKVRSILLLPTNDMMPRAIPTTRPTKLGGGRGGGTGVSASDCDGEGLRAQRQ